MTGAVRITCPRRMSEMGSWEHAGGLDTVRSNDTCSFCGSLMPEPFLERVRAGAELGPTDKPYKVYLSEPWGKFYFQHFNNDQRKEFFALWQNHQIQFGYPGDFYVLPYFIKIVPST